MSIVLLRNKWLIGTLLYRKWSDGDEDFFEYRGHAQRYVGLGTGREQKNVILHEVYWRMREGLADCLIPTTPEGQEYRESFIEEKNESHIKVSYPRPATVKEMNRLEAAQRNTLKLLEEELTQMGGYEQNYMERQTLSELRKKNDSTTEKK